MGAIFMKFGLAPATSKILNYRLPTMSHIGLLSPLVLPPAVAAHRETAPPGAIGAKSAPLFRRHASILPAPETCQLQLPVPSRLYDEIEVVVLRCPPGFTA